MRYPLLSSVALCLGLSLNTQAAPSVAVDIAPLHSLVSQVMEGVAQPNLLIPAEASPHAYSMRPSEAKALADADLVFWVGESLSPWLEKSLDNLAASAKKIEVLELEGTVTHEFREGATFASHDHGDEGHDDHHDEGHHDDHKEHDHHDEHDHDSHDHHKHEEKHHDHHDEHGAHDHHKHEENHEEKHEEKHHDHHDEHKHDEHQHEAHKGHDHHEEEHHEEDHHEEHDHHDEHDHEGADPHAWLDPANAKVWVKAISEILAKEDPANAATYSSNATKTIASLDALIASTKTKIDALGQPKFVVFHDAYQYFEKRFGIAAAGSISLSSAEDPSPARIKEIRDTVKALGVSCVFTEPQYNPGIVKNVFADSTITTIGVMDPLGASLAEGSSHYGLLIEGMVDSISQCQ